MRHLCLLPLIVLCLQACGQSPEPEEATESDQPTEAAVSVYAAALGVETRLEGDTDRDEARRPDGVLEFFGIQAGDRVLDTFSGGGYYTEILSHVVGPDGSVVAHSNQAYVDFAPEEFENRHAGGRLPNVEVLMAENNELSLDEESFDAIIMVLAYHDLYYADPDNGWPAFDVDAYLAEIHKGLATDGVVGIVDHRAEAGAPRETGGTLHRIDPAAIIEDMEAAGFVLDGESDLLSNDSDDHSLPMFDPAVRGNTDRFILRFRKAD